MRMRGEIETGVSGKLVLYGGWGPDQAEADEGGNDVL